MGAWYFMRMKWEEFELNQDWNLSVVCRPESASPSTGSKKAHAIEQAELLEQAFAVPSKSTLSRA
jgi:2-oxoglutarate dehydrogenase complex dehydrogenase (E1) component-like enzyme